MTEADDNKEINKKIQEASDELSHAPLEGVNRFSPALIAHGKILALTSEKITLSVDKLHESSKRLEYFTKILILLTILLFVITLAGILLPADLDKRLEAVLLIIIFGVFTIKFLQLR